MRALARASSSAAGRGRCRRDRRRCLRQPEPVHRRGAACRGCRRAHRQAWQSLGVLALRQCRRARGAGPAVCRRRRKMRARCYNAAGFTFLFAPNFHPAMKAIAPVRRALGVRTVFNLLGPLTNPAAPPFGLIGACDLPTARLLADALAGMPIQRAFVVHGDPGWDEATPVGPFTVFDVRPGVVRRGRRDPGPLRHPAVARLPIWPVATRPKCARDRGGVARPGSWPASRCAGARRRAGARSDGPGARPAPRYRGCPARAGHGGEGARLLERLRRLAAGSHEIPHEEARKGRRIFSPAWALSSAQRASAGMQRCPALILEARVRKLSLPPPLLTVTAGLRCHRRGEAPLAGSR
jgi:hypothetical protein